MRLVTLKTEGKEVGGIVIRKGIVKLETVNKEFNGNWPTDIFNLIVEEKLEELNKWYKNGGVKVLEELDLDIVSFEEAKYGPLYRNPQKIFGIGLNYKDHASDLAEISPNSVPASFFKPATTIIGNKDEIIIPLQSEKTTGEAELGIIFGKVCEDVEKEEWLDYVAGYTTIIDMTAEDILRLNPRYLTMVKSFETFFSFGPQLVTPDEIDDVLKLKVATVINGQIHAENTVSNMTFHPDYLVSFHSKVMKFLPGDILSTGTPRAVHIKEGDIVECHIDGFEPLINPVIDKKLHKNK
jgi:2-keto-4-pentenoate hydratase/2-oxohepta-3-ene-1,7-dioic acid hydratase in catechol pathway